MPRAIALAVLTGLLLGFSFPPFSWSSLVWISLVPVLFNISKNFRVNFLWGWTAGFISNLIIFFWLWPTFAAAKINPIVTLGAWGLLAGILGIYTGLFLLIYSLVPTKWWAPLIGAAAWVSLDFLKGILLTGFPWALLAHTQAFHLRLIQIASLTGAEGVTFLIVGINLGLYETVRKNFSIRYLGPMLLIVGLSSWWGTHQLQREWKADRLMKVALLQGNIDQYRKWDANFESDIRRIYETLADQAVSDPNLQPDLLIWPESAVPGWYPNDPVYFNWVRKIAGSTNKIQLLGAVCSWEGKDHNSAFLVNKNGALIAQYDKQHLVPFGEYIPFGKFLGRWIPYLGQLGTFQEGSGPATFTFENIRMAPNICYEAVFPGLVRRSLLNRSEVIVNLTNDGWYLNSGAPLQHFVVNIFRAVENGRFLIRAANTGISGVIDPFGRVLIRSRLNETTVLHSELKLPARPLDTVYNTVGPWFSWVCCLVTVGMIGGAFLKTR